MNFSLFNLIFVGGKVNNLQRYLQPNHVERNEIYDTYDTVGDNGVLCTRDYTKHPEPRNCYCIFFVR